MKAINLGHAEKYKGLWVTLTKSYDRVISADADPTKALGKALKRGYKNPTLYKVPKENIAYIGGSTGSYVAS